MATDKKLVSTGSQTVGPFFIIGLDDLIDRVSALEEGSSAWISIHGQVLDRDGAAVPDAMLEFWSPVSESAEAQAGSSETGFPAGFRRVATDSNGNFLVTLPRPIQTAVSDGRMQAPHLLVLVFARGLMRHLISRLYFSDELANTSDPVLQGVPIERRGTLVARQDSSSSYCWNVILQGQDETVFFAW